MIEIGAGTAPTTANVPKPPRMSLPTWRTLAMASGSGRAA
jgi:hypothetical protein